MAAVNLIAHSSTPYQRLARQTPKFGRIVDSPARIFYNSNMNRFAYRTTGLAIKAFQWLSKANLKVHGEHQSHSLRGTYQCTSGLLRTTADST